MANSNSSPKISKANQQKNKRFVKAYPKEIRILPPIALKLLLLIRYESFRKGFCDLCTKDLMKRTSLKKRTVYKYLSFLEKNGDIIRFTFPRQIGPIREAVLPENLQSYYDYQIKNRYITKANKIKERFADQIVSIYDEINAVKKNLNQENLIDNNQDSASARLCTPIKTNLNTNKTTKEFVRIDSKIDRFFPKDEKDPKKEFELTFPNSSLDRENASMVLEKYVKKKKVPSANPIGHAISIINNPEWFENVLKKVERIENPEKKNPIQYRAINYEHDHKWMSNIEEFLKNKNGIGIEPTENGTFLINYNLKNDKSEHLKIFLPCGKVKRNKEDLFKFFEISKFDTAEDKLLLIKAGIHVNL